MQFVREGKLESPPISTRPLSEASDTLFDLKNGKIVGRVVLKIPNSGSL